MQSPSMIVLELRVRNHPGVMSHVCNLFARRAYNLDAIICFPVGDGSQSRMWLRFQGNGRVPQILSQVKKLYDVHEAKILEDAEATIFKGIDPGMTG